MKPFIPVWVHLSLAITSLLSTNTGKIHFHRDLNQAPHSSQPSVLTTRLTQKSGVPGSSHNEGGFKIANDKCVSIQGFTMLGA